MVLIDQPFGTLIALTGQDRVEYNLIQHWVFWIRDGLTKRLLKQVAALSLFATLRALKYPQSVHIHTLEPQIHPLDFP